MPFAYAIFCVAVWFVAVTIICSWSIFLFFFPLVVESLSYLGLLVTTPVFGIPFFFVCGIVWIFIYVYCPPFRGTMIYFWVLFRIKLLSELLFWYGCLIPL